MAKIVLDRSGDLRTEAFYRFGVHFEDVPFFPPPPDSIVVPRTPTHDQLVLAGKEGYMWVNASGYAKSVVETKDCPRDKEHVTHRYFTKFGGEAYGGEKRSPLIPTSESDEVFLSDDLCGRIQSLKLRGARIDPVALTLSDNGPKLDGVWALQFMGKVKLRLPHLIDTANACPHCGKGQLFCEGCGEWYVHCPVCGGDMVITESKHKGPEDKRIPLEEDGIWRVLEGKSWDGSDLIQAKGAPFASKRFIDWLLRIHAAPFCAEPVWFCVDGMSDLQKKWFDELQKPFEV